MKDRAIYLLSPIYHFWHFLCDFLQFLCAFFVFFGCIVFCIFYVFNNEDFWCAFFFDFLCFYVYFLHFLYFLLPPIVEVDISDIVIISGITNMVKAIILVINNTPHTTYCIAQYTDCWKQNRFHSLNHGNATRNSPKQAILLILLLLSRLSANDVPLRDIRVRD